MPKLTGIQRRAARNARHGASLDMNLVSLIDVFTILIFFLLSNSTEVQTLPADSVKLPLSTAEKAPKETLVVVVSGQEIVVEGRKVADVAQVMADGADLIPGLKNELDVLSQRQAVSAKAQEANQAITILGDKDIPYQLLRKVMFTCARANFVDVSFAVRQKA